MALRSRLLRFTAILGFVALAACAPGEAAEPTSPPDSLPVSTVTPKPIAPDAETVTFASLGDIGADANADAVLTELGRSDTDLALVVGDLSYGRTGTEKKWCAFVKERVGDTYPFEVVAGNHESNGKNGNINDFSACLPNQLPGLVGTYGRQYYVDVPQDRPLVRFLMISPGIEYPGRDYKFNLGETDYLWTQQAIDSARDAGIPWVVVGAHKPCLSIGRYECESGPDLMSLLLDRRVDLVLHGHEHFYQRTHQLADGTKGCPTLEPGTFNPDCIADSDGEYVQGAGTVAATVGAGGRPIRPASTKDPEFGYFAAFSAKRHNPTHGFLKVTVDEKTLHAEFVGVNGEFTDSFAITR